MVAFIQSRNLNFTKYKLFKLASSMKMEFIFRLKSEHNCSEKEHKTNARLLDDALKIRGVKCWNLVVVCTPYQNFWLRAWAFHTKYEGRRQQTRIFASDLPVCRLFG